MAARGKEVADKNGAVVMILMTNGGAVASRADLDSWVTTFNLPVTSLRPKDGSTFAQLGVRESNFIIDLKTMKIVRKINGSVAGTPPSGAMQAIDAILPLLP